MWLRICILLVVLGVLVKCEDYFYDEGVDEEKVKEMQRNKTLIEEQRRNSETTTTEKEPDWFAKKDSDDPFAKYMEEAFKEYIKKYQKEQAEKLKSRFKSKSDLNHPQLSVITLTAFFGIGVFISLVIVYFKGRTFKNSKPSGDKQKILEKNSYKSVQQNDQIV